MEDKKRTEERKHNRCWITGEKRQTLKGRKEHQSEGRRGKKRVEMYKKENEKQ